MREILFRGKRISDNSWVYGGIYPTFHPNFPQGSEEIVFSERNKNCYAICANGKDVYVYQETVGQYTGLNDKNGNKIFEGDVVAVPKSSYVKSPPYLFNDTIKGVIEFGKYNQPCYEKEKTNFGYK